MGMNHAEAPVLEALVRYRDAGESGFTPPGHKGHAARIHLPARSW